MDTCRQPCKMSISSAYNWIQIKGNNANQAENNMRQKTETARTCDHTQKGGPVLLIYYIKDSGCCISKI